MLLNIIIFFCKYIRVAVNIKKVCGYPLFADMNVLGRYLSNR